MVQVVRSRELGEIGTVKIWANFNDAALPAKVADTAVPEGVDFDFWLGPAPKRSFNSQRFHGSWRMFWDYGVGLMTDWGVHLLSMGLSAMDVPGMPVVVSGVGGKSFQPQRVHETVDTQDVTYAFREFILSWE